MTFAEFNDSYLQPQRNKFTNEKKNDVILMGDFTLDLLYYNTHSPSREFLNKMFSASLSLHFTNGLDDNCICGNLKYSNSDHLAEFLIYNSKPMVKTFDQKEVLHRRNLKNMDKEKFKEALASTNLNEVLATYCNDPNIPLGLLLGQVCSFN